MDRFNSFASQAKAKAESAANSAKTSYDNRNSSSSSSNTTTQSSSRVDPPPPRAPFRSTPTTASSSSSTGGTFVGINDTERKAFFSLLDEYFESRPHYKEFFTSSQHQQQQHSSTPSPISVPTPIPAVIRQAPPSVPVSRGLGQCKALYDYTGSESDDLSFREGDKINVLEHVSDDWWKGNLNGKIGIFPVGYVEMI